MSLLRSAILCLPLVAFACVFCCEFKSPTIVGFSDGSLGFRFFHKANLAKSCLAFNVPTIEQGYEKICTYDIVEDGSIKHIKPYQAPVGIKVGDTVKYQLSYEEKNGDKCKSEKIAVVINSLEPESSKQNL